MATTELKNLDLPVGRFVMGSLSEKQTTDFDGKPIPEEKQLYFFGVAVPKTDPGFNDTWTALWGMAATDYASNQFVMGQINQGLEAKDFAWKIVDGDKPTFDRKTGQQREIRDYVKGHWIFKFSTMFEIDAAAYDPNTGLISQIDRSRDIKRGDWLAVKFNSSVNGKVDDTAGIYLNPVAVCRVAFGDAIAEGISATDAFAGKQFAVPPGASATPTGPAPGNAPVSSPVPVSPQPTAVQMAPPPAPTAAPAYVPPAPGTAVATAPVAPPAPSTASPTSGVPPHPGIMTPPIPGA